jgi:hypothetical protein
MFGLLLTLRAVLPKGEPSTKLSNPALMWSMVDLV